MNPDVSRIHNLSSFNLLSLPPPPPFSFSQLTYLHQGQSLRRKKRRSVLSIFSGFRKNRNSTISNQDSEWVCGVVEGGGESDPTQCTDPEEETAVEGIRRWPLTSLHCLINILMGENILLSPTELCVALHSLTLPLHNGTHGLGNHRQQHCREEKPTD